MSESSVEINVVAAIVFVLFPYWMHNTVPNVATGIASNIVLILRTSESTGIKVKTAKINNGVTMQRKIEVI